MQVEFNQTAAHSGRYLNLGNPMHSCNQPGWWSRRLDGVQWGTIWECRCGNRFRWEGHWAIYEAAHGL